MWYTLLPLQITVGHFIQFTVIPSESGFANSNTDKHQIPIDIFQLFSHNGSGCKFLCLLGKMCYSRTWFIRTSVIGKPYVSELAIQFCKTGMVPELCQFSPRFADILSSCFTLPIHADPFCHKTQVVLMFINTTIFNHQPMEWSNYVEFLFFVFCSLVFHVEWQ